MPEITLDTPLIKECHGLDDVRYRVNSVKAHIEGLRKRIFKELVLGENDSQYPYLSKQLTIDMSVEMLTAYGDMLIVSYEDIHNVIRGLKDAYSSESTEQG